MHGSGGSAVSKTSTTVEAVTEEAVDLKTVDVAEALNINLAAGQQPVHHVRYLHAVAKVCHVANHVHARV